MKNCELVVCAILILGSSSLAMGQYPCPADCYVFVGGSNSCDPLPIVNFCDGDCEEEDDDCIDPTWGVDFFSYNYTVAPWDKVRPAGESEGGYYAADCSKVVCWENSACTCEISGLTLKCKVVFPTFKDTHTVPNLDINTVCSGGGGAS